MVEYLILLVVQFKWERSFKTGVTATTQPGGAYGLFYPDVGILIFNGPILTASASLGHGDGNQSALNIA